MSMYGEDNRATWKKAGLSNYEIYCIIHEQPYNSLHCSRQLGDIEKKLVASWIKKGLGIPQIARLLNVRQLHLLDYYEDWGYEIKH